ncbi:ribonuclease H-like domain-containing protein [Tanacetum coccineum]
MFFDAQSCYVSKETLIRPLYNNLRVYEDELKRSSGSNSASQNLAFLSSENTNSTNEVITTSGDFGVSTAGGINQVSSTPSAHYIAYSFLHKPTNSPNLRIGIFSRWLEMTRVIGIFEWQVAMLTVRVKKFIQMTGRNMDFKEKRPISIDNSGRSQGRRPYGDNGRSNAQTTESSSQALVAQDGLVGYDWSNDLNEVQKCSKCLESFKCLQKNYDTEREKHNKAKLEIRGYEIALESLEARILGHEKNELAWGEKYEFQNYELKCREIKINNLNLELEKVVKERDELKLKIEKWEGSSKNLTKILNNDEDDVCAVKTVSSVKPSVTQAVRSQGNPKILLKDHEVVDRLWRGDYEDLNRGFVAFGSDPKGGKITGKGKIKTANLDFDDVYFIDELKFNLFYVSQMCNKKTSVLFTESECLILSPSFKLLVESQVVLRSPRKDYVYSLDLKNIVPSGGLENQLNYNVKIIRFDNGTEFKNYAMNEFCAKKESKWEFSKSPSISFMRPFGCPLTILNTLDSLGKFDGKSDEGYLLGYSTSSKAFRVYNKRTKRVEENLHINFLKDQPNVAGTGPNWMFDLDFLTNSMNYIPVSVENQVIVDAGTQDSYVAGSSGKDKGPTQEYILLPLQPHRTRILVKDVVQDAQEQPSKNASPDKGIQDSEDVFDKEGQHQMPEDEQVWKDELEIMVTQELVANAMNDESRQAFEEEKRRIASQKKAAQATSKIPIDASTLPNADLPIDLNMPDLEDASDTLPNDGIFNGAYYDDEDVGVVADFNNMDNTIDVSPIPTLRIHKDHPKGHILGDPTSTVQTRGKIQKAFSA